MNTWVDTHCHLYDPIFKEEFILVKERCMELGISKILMPNIDSISIEKALLLSKENKDWLYCMNGIHPCYVSHDWKIQWEKIKVLFDTHQFVAIGEIGLDYYHNEKTKKEQKDIFIEQIEKALELNLPVVLHTRNAMKDCIEILQHYSNTTITGVFHCFSEGYHYIDKIVHMNFYFGIGGVVTYKNSGLSEAIIEIPLERIILETDSPYLSPHPFRGKRNSPTNIPLIGEKLAALKQLPTKQIAHITTMNAKKLFNLSDN